MRSATWPASLPRYPSSVIPDKYYYQEWHFSRLSWQFAFVLGAKPHKNTQKHAVSQFDIAIAWRTHHHRQQQITHKQNAIANFILDMCR